MYINEASPLQEPDYMTEEQINSIIKRIHFRSGNTSGEIYLMEPYDGIQIWVSELDSRSSTLFSYTEEGSFLCLSYCFEGRYEMEMSSKDYIYAEKGILSIDTTPFDGVTSFTKGKYRGMEIIIDLNWMKGSLPDAWAECGIDLLEIADCTHDAEGSLLMKVTPEWEDLAGEMAKSIQEVSLPEGDYRFLLLQLLWKFKHEKKRFQKYNPQFLTPGQRAIAIRTEKKLTSDLQKRFIITEMAEEIGISASSLKKYFTLYFGKSITLYMKEQRLEKAKQLLKNTPMAIAEVANLVGYENQGKFGTMFREEVGCTPIEYRRLHCPPYQEGERNEEIV